MSSTYHIKKNIDPSIFRAYDIRGIVESQLCLDTVYTIGLAIGSQIIENHTKQVICGHDGRLSSPDLAQALHQGLMDTGCEVIDLDSVPSPIVYFATHHLQVNNAVILTGSHNPAEYNGLKVILNGAALTSTQITQLYTKILSKQFIYGEGDHRLQNLIPAYISTIAHNIQLKRKLNIVVDCGNGIAGKFAKELFTAIGCNVIELYCEVDGNFPNHHPDPTVFANLRDLIATVQQQKADIGIAFDGDADRLVVVTDQGKIINPDRLLILFARDVLIRNPGAKIIFDVKCTENLPKTIIEYGGEAIMCQTGHSIIKLKMIELNAILAGEMSGHIFFKEKWYGFDDGLYAACRLLEIIAQQNLTSEELFATVPDSVNTPEIKIEMADLTKFVFMEQLKRQADFADGKLNDLDGVRVTFTDGWGLIRASNTTPCLIARFEARDENSLARIITIFKQQLLKVDSNLSLSF